MREKDLVTLYRRMLASETSLVRYVKRTANLCYQHAETLVRELRSDQNELAQEVGKAVTEGRWEDLRRYRAEVKKTPPPLDAREKGRG